MASTKALFLHWGPGGCCEVERKWFGDSLGVAFWDQPKFREDDPRAFSKLLDAAEAELARLASSGPIALIGHSFGGQLALALSMRKPALVSEITLLSASEWPARAFVALASRMESLGKKEVSAPLA